MNTITLTAAIAAMIDSGVEGVTVTSRNREWSGKLTRGFVIPSLAVAAIKAAKIGKRENLQFVCGSRAVLTNGTEWKVAEGREVVSIENPTRASCLVEWLTEPRWMKQVSPECEMDVIGLGCSEHPSELLESMDPAALVNLLYVIDDESETLSITDVIYNIPEGMFESGTFDAWMWNPKLNLSCGELNEETWTYARLLEQTCRVRDYRTLEIQCPGFSVK